MAHLLSIKKKKYKSFTHQPQPLYLREDELVIHGTWLDQKILIKETQIKFYPLMFLWCKIPGYLAIVLRTFASMTTSTASSSQVRVRDHELVSGQCLTDSVMLCSIYVLYHHSSVLVAYLGLQETHSKSPHGTGYTSIMSPIQEC